MSSAWIAIARASARYALSSVWGIPRSKGTAARADGLVIKFERADAVDIKSQATTCSWVVVSSEKYTRYTVVSSWSL